MTTPKVLIATAWWPNKTPCFARYSAGVVAQLDGGPYESELFITTNYADTKFQSIVGAMSQAQEWAEAHGFTHVLNVEADKELPAGTLGRLLEADKDVVYPGRGQGKGLVKIAPGAIRAPLEKTIGWGVVLVRTSVLSLCPFNSYVGEYLWPDQAWWKRLAFEGIGTWVDFDTPIGTLIPPADRPSASFNPTKEALYGQAT